MAESVTKFGTAEYKDKIAGLKITSVQLSTNAQKAKVLDEDGEEYQRDYYDHEDVLTIEANVVGPTDALKTGAKVTIGNDVYYIDSYSKRQGNTSHETYSLTLSKKGSKVVAAT